MPCNRLPRIIKKVQNKRHKEPEETDEETSGCVRPERFNKWPNSKVAGWWWWWWCSGGGGGVVVVLVVVVTDIEDTVMIRGSTYARCSKHYFEMYNTVHGYLNLSKALRKTVYINTTTLLEK
jgi:hypothetical protein